MADASAKLAIEKLADYIAGISPTLRRSVSGSNKIEVFAHAASEADAASVYSIVRMTGGNRPHNPPPMLRVQVMTIAMVDADALTRAELIQQRLIGSNNRPIRDVTSGSVVLNVNNLGVPALLGRRDNGRVDASFNFDLWYRPAA